MSHYNTHTGDTQYTQSFITIISTSIWLTMIFLINPYQALGGFKGLTSIHLTTSPSRPSWTFLCSYGMISIHQSGRSRGTYSVCCPLVDFSLDKSPLSGSLIQTGHRSGKNNCGHMDVVASVWSIFANKIKCCRRMTSTRRQP